MDVFKDKENQLNLESMGQGKMIIFCVTQSNSLLNLASIEGWCYVSSKQQGMHKAKKVIYKKEIWEARNQWKGQQKISQNRNMERGFMWKLINREKQEYKTKTYLRIIVNNFHKAYKYTVNWDTNGLRFGNKTWNKENQILTLNPFEG